MLYCQVTGLTGEISSACDFPASNSELHNRMGFPQLRSLAQSYIWSYLIWAF